MNSTYALLKRLTRYQVHVSDLDFSNFADPACSISSSADESSFDLSVQAWSKFLHYIMGFLLKFLMLNFITQAVLTILV